MGSVLLIKLNPPTERFSDQIPSQELRTHIDTDSESAHSPSNQIIEDNQPKSEDLLPDISDAMAQSFIDGDYKALANYFPDKVEFSYFASSYMITLPKNELIEEIKKKAQNISYWEIKQDAPDIIYAKQAHLWEEDNFIIIGDDEVGYAFMLDQERKIESVIEFQHFMLPEEN